ncbi:O-antigen ligase family protein [Aliamphritea ceti]|uniref:O-antigen ligase family protein n=1 Tax=Aliamphritea ceti TaxID=1524258 RepID=UPI0021C45335|nr:O-antigen ligase family protein [Aliamphritea ceti]
MAGTLVFSYVLYRSSTILTFTSIIICALTLGAILSLFFGFFIPDLGIHAGETSIDHIGLWKGVYGFKNHLGRFMVVLTLAVFVMIFVFKRTDFKYFLILLMSMFLIYKSGSSTALLLLFICPLIYCFLNIIVSSKINRYIQALVLLIFLSFVLIGILVLPYIVVEIFGKDMTGSGRTDIWFSLFNVSQSPLIGHGFGGVFWGEYNSAYYLLDEAWFNLGHAHNGWVDIWIELGYIGLFLYLLITLKVVYAAYNLVFRKKYNIYAYIFLLILFLFLYSFSGGGFVKQNNMLWVLFCCSWYYVYSRERINVNDDDVSIK